MVGPFLTGGTFTLADIATFPAFERLAITLPHFLKWDALEPCPRLRAWIAATRARPSVNATLQVQDKEQKLLAVSVFLRAHK
jgi:glutathione S-transferase